MQILEIIEKKKNSEVLTEEEINFFVDGYTKNSIPDYQISSLLMAIYFNGMNKTETYHLTKAMVNSGTTINLSKADGPVIDKHSTGGVGDKVSLIVAPICAALGLNVAKISGTGLGHTGGTIDKLNAMGISTDISVDQAKELLTKTKMFIMSQTENIVPADKLFYSLRSATGTVDSLPLVASSICSKKLALDTDCIFIDVKFGDGSFCKKYSEAIELAGLMRAIFKKFKRRSMIHTTSMEQPLGRSIGNTIEVNSAYSFLLGIPESRELKEFIYRFVGDILWFTGKAKRIKTGFLIDEAIKSGKAKDMFINWAIAQGADSAVFEKKIFVEPEFTTSIKAYKRGFVTYRSAREIGLVSNMLGVGRMTKGESVDFKAGIYLNKVRGEQVQAGEEVATLYSSHPIGKDIIQRFENNIKIKKHSLKRLKMFRKTYISK